MALVEDASPYSKEARLFLNINTPEELAAAEAGTLIAEV